MGAMGIRSAIKRASWHEMKISGTFQDTLLSHRRIGGMTTNQINNIFTLHSSLHAHGTFPPQPTLLHTTNDKKTNPPPLFFLTAFFSRWGFGFWGGQFYTFLNSVGWDGDFPYEKQNRVLFMICCPFSSSSGNEWIGDHLEWGWGRWGRRGGGGYTL